MAATRDVLCELLRLFYDKGWVTGTGGGICALEAPGRLLLAPTGVHKERVLPPDLFVVDPADGRVVELAADEDLKPSECGGVFCAIVRLRGAGSVVHSHGLDAVLAADMARESLTIRRLEMLKGLRGVANTDTHVVAVVENTPREAELVSAIDDVLADERYASAFAILVRDHGAYIWGADVWEAKRHAEVYHWLFQAVRQRGGT